MTNISPVMSLGSGSLRQAGHICPAVVSKAPQPMQEGVSGAEQRWQNLAPGRLEDSQARHFMGISQRTAGGSNERSTNEQRTSNERSTNEQRTINERSTQMGEIPWYVDGPSLIVNQRNGAGLMLSSCKPSVSCRAFFSIASLPRQVLHDPLYNTYVSRGCVKFDAD